MIELFKTNLEMQDTLICAQLIHNCKLLGAKIYENYIFLYIDI